MPQPIINNLDQIHELAEKKTRENMNFRKFIKFDCKLSDIELDEVVGATADKVAAQIDCTRCGNCCRGLQVVVDNDDIGRLASRQGITFQAFKRKHVQSDGERTLFFKDAPCSFLKGDSCSVYEDRPTCCRDFPYLNTAGFRQRTLMLIGFSAMCPIVYNTLEILKDELNPSRKQ